MDEVSSEKEKKREESSSDVLETHTLRADFSSKTILDSLGSNERQSTSSVEDTESDKPPKRKKRDEGKS